MKNKNESLLSLINTKGQIDYIKRLAEDGKPISEGALSNLILNIERYNNYLEENYDNTLNNSEEFIEFLSKEIRLGDIVKDSEK